MVAGQIEARGVSDARTLEALRRVPRHLFAPAQVRAQAHADRALPLDHGQTLSQPYVVAFMTASLGLHPGARVLEVGTGSGYQTAVLAELGAQVYSLELIPELAANARARLCALGYRGVLVRCGDGYLGWPEQAPFDAVLVAAAAPRVPEPLRAQLADGGRLLLPLGDEAQQLLLVKRHGTRFEERHLLDVRFVPMLGRVRQGG
jgi:protein-L-isoaspartate(D-aspartate) O-methyltransferase